MVAIEPNSVASNEADTNGASPNGASSNSAAPNSGSETTWAGYDFQGHSLDRGGHRYHYLDEGIGSPVVMVHGNPTWSYYYRNLVKKLRDHHRVIVPDHMGCGLSDKPSDDEYDYHLASRVADLKALIDHTIPGQRFTLVVHDWGGAIGMLYAVRHAARIERIVLLNTGAFHLPESKPFPWLLRVAAHPLWGALTVRGLNIFSLATSYFGCRRRQMPEAVRAGYLAPYRTWSDRRAVHRFVQDIPLRTGDRGYELISEIERGLDQFKDRPIRVFWGEKDFVFDRHFLAEWRKRWPHADVTTFPDAGHYILEDAAEEVIPEIARFIDEGCASDESGAASR